MWQSQRVSSFYRPYPITFLGCLYLTGLAYPWINPVNNIIFWKSRGSVQTSSHNWSLHSVRCSGKTPTELVYAFPEMKARRRSVTESLQTNSWRWRMYVFRRLCGRGWCQVPSTVSLTCQFWSKTPLYRVSSKGHQFQVSAELWGAVKEGFRIALRPSQPSRLPARDLMPFHCPRITRRTSEGMPMSSDIKMSVCMTILNVLILSGLGVVHAATVRQASSEWALKVRDLSKLRGNDVFPISMTRSLPIRISVPELVLTPTLGSNWRSARCIHFSRVLKFLRLY